MYLYLVVMQDTGAGLVAAATIAIVPGYISRSVAGSYDNEGTSRSSLVAFTNILEWTYGL